MNEIGMTISSDRNAYIPLQHCLPVDISGAEVGKVAELGGEDPLVVVRIR